MLRGAPLCALGAGVHVRPPRLGVGPGEQSPLGLDGGGCVARGPVVMETVLFGELQLFLKVVIGKSSIS